MGLGALDDVSPTAPPHLLGAERAALLADELGQLLVAELAAALLDELAGDGGHGDSIALAGGLGGTDELIFHTIGVDAAVGKRGQELLVRAFGGCGGGDFGDLACAAVLRFFAGTAGGAAAGRGLVARARCR